jgi:hypothetical protein
VLGGDILLLGMTERPNLIALDTLAGKAPQGLVLEISASPAHINEEFGSRVLGNPRNPNRGTDTVALD